MVFYWNWNDSKSPQVSRTLLSILANFNDSVVWMISYFQVHQSLYQSFGDCTKITNQNWYNHHFHFHSLFFFSSLARTRYLSFFSPSFDFTLWSAGTAKFTIRSVLFFLPLLVSRIFFRWFGKCCFFLYYLVLSCYLFSLPTFGSNFYFSLWVVLFVLVVLFFASSEYIFTFCFSIFASSRSFLICDSNLSSHPNFDILSVVFRATPIFLHTSFFLDFGLDSPPILVPERRQCGFLFEHDSFHNFWTHFTFLGSVFASLCLRLGVSGFPVFSVSVSLLEVCWYVCLYICWWISSISRSENQPFFIIVLTWSASFWFVVFVGLLLK